VGKIKGRKIVKLFSLIFFFRSELEIDDVFWWTGFVSQPQGLFFIISANLST
jgi:hypothetical protein